MDDEIDRIIYVTAMQSLFVQNRQQTHDWTLIGSGANGIGILVWKEHLKNIVIYYFFQEIFTLYLHQRMQYTFASIISFLNQCSLHLCFVKIKYGIYTNNEVLDNCMIGKNASFYLFLK